MDFESTGQVNPWCDLESYSALKQVGPQTAAYARAPDLFENTTGRGTLSDIFGQKLTSNCPTITS